MPDVVFTTSGHQDVLNAVQAQQSALGKLAKEIAACGTDTAKMAEVWKAFTIEQGKSVESSKIVSKTLAEKSKTLKQVLGDLAKHRTEVEKENQALEKYRGILQQTQEGTKRLGESHQKATESIRRAEGLINRLGDQYAKGQITLDRFVKYKTKADEVIRQANSTISRSIGLQMENDRRTELATRAVEHHTVALRQAQQEQERLSPAGQKLAETTARIDAGMKLTEQVFDRNRTKAQQLEQEWRRLSMLLKELKLDPAANAEKILQTERAMKLVRQELTEMTAGFKRMSEAARAGMQIVNNAVEKALTPLQRYQRDLRLVEQLYASGKIKANEYRIAKNQLWNDYQQGVSAGNRELQSMDQILPGVISKATSLAGAFGVFISVAGAIQMARQELEKIKNIRNEMHDENVELGAVLTHIGEVIFSGDPRLVSSGKQKALDIADELKINPLSVALTFRAALAASSKATMEEKIKEAEEVTKAAMLYFPLTRDREKAEELALGAQNVWKWDPTIQSGTEAVAKVQLYGTATQVTDPKKIAEFAPKAIGALTPYGDSPEFAATLYGEATHLMTDSSGAPEVGFVGRMGKFLFDFSMARDKKTNQLLFPDMHELKTTEERLAYLHDLALNRPDFDLEGEAIEYLKGISPEQHREILEQIGLKSDEIDTIMNITEEQLKEQYGYTEEFIRRMKGRGLAVQWGPMVHFLTNKDAIKRFRDRFAVVKEGAKDPIAAYNADIASREADPLYRAAETDEHLVWHRYHSSMQYVEEGKFQKVRDYLIENLPLRVGTPALQRELAKIKDGFSAIQDWRDLYDTVAQNMVDTAKNTNLSADDRLKAINVMMDALEILRETMPEEDRKRLRFPLAKQQALVEFIISTANDKTFTKEVLEAHIGNTVSLEEMNWAIATAEKFIEDKKKHVKEMVSPANTINTVIPSAGLIEFYLEPQANFRTLNNQDIKGVNNVQQALRQIGKAPPVPQQAPPVPPVPQQAPPIPPADPVEEEQARRKLAMVPRLDRLPERFDAPYLFLAQFAEQQSADVLEKSINEEKLEALELRYQEIVREYEEGVEERKRENERRIEEREAERQTEREAAWTESTQRVPDAVTTRRTKLMLLERYDGLSKDELDQMAQDPFLRYEANDFYEREKRQREQATSHLPRLPGQGNPLFDITLPVPVGVEESARKEASATVTQDDGLKNTLLEINKTLQQFAQLAPTLNAFNSIIPIINRIQNNQNEFERIVAANSATLGGHPSV